MIKSHEPATVQHPTRRGQQVSQFELIPILIYRQAPLMPPWILYRAIILKSLTCLQLFCTPNIWNQDQHQCRHPCWCFRTPWFRLRLLPLMRLNCHAHQPNFQPLMWPMLHWESWTPMTKGYSMRPTVQHHFIISPAILLMMLIGIPFGYIKMDGGWITIIYPEKTTACFFNYMG